MASTSYFSTPEDTLDPDLFGSGDSVLQDIRMEILARVFSFFNHHGFHGVESWLEVWLAGSGVSYQWSAHRDPGDLDCLLGVHYVDFRAANEKYAGLSDTEIASALNEMMWRDLWPTTADFRGRWELTFYVNPDSTDIRNINPYAAYDLRHNEWTVRPSRDQVAKPNQRWDLEAQRDNDRAREIVARYTKTLAAVQNAQNPAHRANQEVYLNGALLQAHSLYQEIHEGRREAFSRTGGGYLGRGNYRWQSGKALGTVPALKQLSDYYEQLLHDQDYATYGIEMPDTATLIFRAALWEQ